MLHLPLSFLLHHLDNADTPHRHVLSELSLPDNDNLVAGDDGRVICDFERCRRSLRVALRDNKRCLIEGWGVFRLADEGVDGLADVYPVIRQVLVGVLDVECTDEPLVGFDDFVGILLGNAAAARLVQVSVGSRHRIREGRGSEAEKCDGKETHGCILSEDCKNEYKADELRSKLLA